MEGSATESDRFNIPLRAALAAGMVVMVLEHAVALDNSVATDVVDALQGAAAVPVIAGELAIDTEPTRRLIFPEKCEAAGERELRALARTAEIEEAFAFLPDHCTWVEIGLSQTPSSVSIERAVIDMVVHLFGRVTVYHLHPGASGGAAGHFPAFSDLVGSLLIDGPYLKDDRVEILHRAVTPRGRYQYAFQPSERAAQLIDVIFSSGLVEFAGENLLLSYIRPEHEAEYYDAIRRCARRGEDVRFTSCFPMRAGDFVLLYAEGEDQETAVGSHPESIAEAD